MTTSDLPSNMFPFSLFHAVNERIRSWNGSPVFGRALYNKPSSIVYLSLSVYPRPQDPLVRSKVIWHVPDYPVVKVHPDYKADIGESLLFFQRYLAALRGEVVPLTFEILDLAFDETAARHHPFTAVAALALINCFDHELHRCRMESVDVLKERNACFRPDW